MNDELARIIIEEICSYYDIDEEALFKGNEFKRQRGANFEREFYKTSRLPYAILNFIYYRLTELSGGYEDWFDSLTFGARVCWCMKLIETDESAAEDIFEIESRCIIRLGDPAVIKGLLKEKLREKQCHNEIANDLRRRLEPYEYAEHQEKRRAEFSELMSRAEAGDIEAQIEVSRHYSSNMSDEKDDALAFKWLLRAAEQGDADSQAEIAEIYRSGSLGVIKDKEEAFRWYMRSAENGRVQSMYLVGECYFQGKGVEQDNRKAFEWFIKSAEKGYRSGQYWVGKCCYEGLGTEQDKKAAYHWIELAAEAKNRPAVKFLNMHCEEYEDYKEAKRGT